MKQAVQLATTVLLLWVTASLSIPAHADPFSMTIFEKICVDSAPDFRPDIDILAMLGAKGDDPTKPGRAYGGGENWGWTIDLPDGGNMLVQAYAGKLDGKPASGCDLATADEADEAALSEWLARSKWVPLREPETSADGATIRRWETGALGKLLVFSVISRSNVHPEDAYHTLRIENLPKAEFEKRRTGG